jgi:hypothetical protein
VATPRADPARNSPFPVPRLPNANGEPPDAVNLWTLLLPLSVTKTLPEELVAALLGVKKEPGRIPRPPQALSN